MKNKLSKDVVFGRVSGEDRGKDVMDPPKIITDPLYHLRSDKRDNPLVLKLIKEENKNAEKKTENLKDLSNKLYKEYLSHIKETMDNAPYNYKGYKWFTSTKKGKDYLYYWREKNNEKELVLDVNNLAKDKPFCSIGSLEVHPNKDWILYTVDFKGDEIYHPYFFNLKNKRLLYQNDFPEDQNFKIDDMIWCSDDDKVVFYTTANDEHRPNKVFMHVLGTDIHECLFEEEDPKFEVAIEESDSREYFFIHTGSAETSEVHYIDYKLVSDGNFNKSKLKCLFPRKFGVDYSVEHHGDYFYVITDQDNAKNSKLMRYNLKTGSYKDVKPYDKKITLEGIQAFENFLILEGRTGGESALWLLEIDFDNNVEWSRIPGPHKNTSISLGINKEYKTDIIQIDTESYIHPESVYKYDTMTQDYKLIWENPVPNYNQKDYVTDKVFVKSRDKKTDIPLYLIYKKSFYKEGLPIEDNGFVNVLKHENKFKGGPCLLYGYGSYGVSLDPEFDITHIPLLNRGIIFCVANIRGGGEKGKTWYEDGKYLKKKNTFYDFIDCADYLIDNKITSPDRLAIEGRSAGGLLMGAVLNMAPEKFAVAFCGVPFVDVATTVSDPSIPLTTQEWEEWGNPNEEKYFNYILSYSPYNNVKKGVRYPQIIVTAGLWDPRVQYWEPLKWVTKLRQLNPDTKVILKTNMAAGHFASSGRYDKLKERAWDYAAILGGLGYN